MSEKSSAEIHDDVQEAVKPSKYNKTLENIRSNIKKFKQCQRCFKKIAQQLGDDDDIRGQSVYAGEIHTKT